MTRRGALITLREKKGLEWAYIFSATPPFYYNVHQWLSIPWCSLLSHFRALNDCIRYRSVEEINDAKTHDPIERAYAFLNGNGW